MAQKSKDFEYFSCKMDKNVSDALEKYCTDSRMSKTAVVEIAVTEYLEKQKKTKRSKKHPPFFFKRIEGGYLFVS